MYAKARADYEKSKALRDKANEVLSKSEAEAAKRKRRGELAKQEVIRIPEDIREDPRYEGQTSFLLKGVPMHCQDGKSDVNSDTIREWILFAIIEEDPYSKFFFKKMKDIDDRLAVIDHNIKMIPTLNFLDENGAPKPEIVARREREILFDKYGEDRVIAENELSVVKFSLEKHIQWRRKMSIDFTKIHPDLNTDTCTWIIKIFNVADAYQLENLLIAKNNWSGIRLAAGDVYREPALPPWAGREPIPDGSRDGVPDYTTLAVDAASIRIMRLPQGMGVIKQLDRSSSTYSADEFNIFYGEFEAGKKSGYGVEISDIGVYSGNYMEGFRNGRGRLDLQDGTTIVGSFGVTIPNKAPESSEFINPYMEGEPNGTVEINFGDGGLYRGEMKNGRITGK
eukprot:gene13712-18392_t